LRLAWLGLVVCGSNPQSLDYLIKTSILMWKGEWCPMIQMAEVVFRGIYKVIIEVGNLLASVDKNVKIILEIKGDFLI